LQRAALVVALFLFIMSAIIGGSRRPRLYAFVAAFFLAVFFFSFVGFHDVGLGRFVLLPED
jgi:disulfide bond formation protein DsbB